MFHITIHQYWYYETSLLTLSRATVNPLLRGHRKVASQERGPPKTGFTKSEFIYLVSLVMMTKYDPSKNVYDKYFNN